MSDQTTEIPDDYWLGWWAHWARADCPVTPNAARGWQERERLFAIYMVNKQKLEAFYART